jgi:hypothetical protein
MNFTGGKGFPVFTQNLKIQSVKKKQEQELQFPVVSNGKF